MSTRYDNWSREDLVLKIAQLENALHNPNHGAKTTRSKSQLQPTTPSSSKASDRQKIALLFTYSGAFYSGLAFQSTYTPLPTVESVLFNALAKARLVDGEAGLEGCGWERCGRTDKGVSSAGQVVSLWVRKRGAPLPSAPDVDEASRIETEKVAERDDVADAPDDGFGSLNLDKSPLPPPQTQQVQSEHNFPRILNRLLPQTIRVLAWSHVKPEFSARFSCVSRHYKYFFTAGELDIPAMRDAAARLVGLHDFRNMCKVDPGKQITVFDRRIIQATIDPVSNSGNDMFVFNLIGTAFLYNQVRHIMALLFLVGAKLEAPSIINDLFDVENIRGKPEYQMADALPLVLWKCAYNEGDVQWRGQAGGELMRELKEVHERSLIGTTLDQHFREAAVSFSDTPSSDATFMPLGGGTSRKTSSYVPVLKRTRLDSVELINQRWRDGKGARRTTEETGGDRWR